MIGCAYRVRFGRVQRANPVEFAGPRYVWAGRVVNLANTLALTGRRANFSPIRPALARSVFLTLTPEQQRFLMLHAKRRVEKWQWLWGSTILRASTERDYTATIPAAQFDELLRLGLMRRSGCAGAVITDMGREACT